MNVNLNSDATLRFTLAGEKFSLTPREVTAALSGHSPEPIRTYWVFIGGREWPVKQTLSLATGLSPREFQSSSAQLLLKKLGFKVQSRVDRDLKTRPADSQPERVAPSKAAQSNQARHPLAPDVQSLITHLTDESQCISIDAFLESRDEPFNNPGLYSWWVNVEGAANLSSGFAAEEKLEAGLIYAGLAGATRAGGKRSENTLRKRIAKMHLGKNHSFSTLRLTLGSILAAATGASYIDEELLTRWMKNHLRIVAIPFADVDKLGEIESQILAALDPPLNLDKVSRKVPRRVRLSELRKRYSKKEK